MSSATLHRRIRKLEGAFGSDDIRHYLHRPLVKWPDHILQLGIELGEEELSELVGDHRSCLRPDSPTEHRCLAEV